MIYGNVFLPKKEESASILEFGVESVVYNEYVNYKGLLESCTDDDNRSILEAQVQILCEISFKDIIEKIKKAWENFKAWVKSIWDKIFGKEKTVEEKKKKAEESVKDIKKDAAEKSSASAEEKEKEEEKYPISYKDMTGITINDKDFIEFDKLSNYIKEKVIGAVNVNEMMDVVDSIVNLNNEFDKESHKFFFNKYAESSNTKTIYEVNYAEFEVKDWIEKAKVASKLFTKAMDLESIIKDIKKSSESLKSIYNKMDTAISKFSNTEIALNDDIQIRVRSINLLRHTLQLHNDNLVVLENRLLDARGVLYDQINGPLCSGIKFESTKFEPTRFEPTRFEPTRFEPTKI